MEGGEIWFLYRQPELDGSATSRGGGGTGLVELVNLFLRSTHSSTEILL